MTRFRFCWSSRTDTDVFAMQDILYCKSLFGQSDLSAILTAVLDNTQYFADIASRRWRQGSIDSASAADGQLIVRGWALPNQIALVLVDPAGQGDQEKLERMRKRPPPQRIRRTARR
jgi:hypothetical protein